MKITLVLGICLSLLVRLSAGQSYGTLAVRAPEKSVFGWSVSPDETAVVETAVFVVPSPAEKRGVSSGLWRLEIQGYLLRFTPLETYDQPVVAARADMDSDGVLDIIVYLKKTCMNRFVEAKRGIIPQMESNIFFLGFDLYLRKIFESSRYVKNNSCFREFLFNRSCENSNKAILCGKDIEIV